MEIQVNGRAFEPYLAQHDIAERVALMARTIEKEYTGLEPLFIAVLNGSFLFAADLVRNIRGACRINFIKVASYEGTGSSGKVNEVLGLNESIAGRDVIILEDIIDTGLTVKYLLDTLAKQQPASIRTAALLFKKEAFLHTFTPDYVGFEVPNKFLVGYGLDYDGYGRNLPQIYTLKGA